MNNMSVNVKDFRDLIVWQKAKSLQRKVRAILPRFPELEKYNLTSQLLLCSSSVGANIAEGCGQLYKKKEITHYNIALGSTSEVRDGLKDALDYNYITPEEYSEMDSEAEEIIKMLYGLIRKLKNELRNSKEDSDEE
ncbi:four helix bundle protein [Defluviitalea saccharophila]|uniref:Four helix bundle protein n=1 Tax=Defluviitalea saccharophila TaxID=879970 RepID=A0ABZ2Y235_9FIRM